MISDESFREAYKPLQVPSHYDINGSREDRVLFALAHITEGTVPDVALEMARLEPDAEMKELIIIAGDVLSGLYTKGLLKGSEIDGIMHYNLSKITEANDGTVDPDLLAPGLD